MKNKGFTLIELMIALSVFTLIIGYMYKVYFDELESLNSISGKSQNQYDGSIAMNHIIEVIRSGSNVSLAESTVIDGNGTILIDISGTPNSSAELYFDKNESSLKDKNGSTISKGIQSISIVQSGDVLDITLNLLANKESHTLKTSVNVKN